jgi:hypothetical protein
VSSIFMGRSSVVVPPPPLPGWTALAHSSDFERNMLDFFDSKFSMSCVRFEVLTAVTSSLSTNAVVPSFDENQLSLIQYYWRTHDFN